MCEQIPFSSLVKINPPLDCTLPSPSAEVSFISMQDVTSSGDWIHRQSRPLQSIGSGYTPFQEDDVLFAKITPCMENGKGAHATELLNGLGFGSTEFHVLRAVNDTSSRFVFHVCNSRRFRQSAEAQMTGSAGQKRVPVEFFSRFFVPRFSREEQRALATVLDSMDEAIRRTEAVIAKLRQVKAGMLHDLLTRGLDENGELRDPLRHPEQFKDSPLGRIPTDWEWYTLGSIGSWVGGHTPSKGVDKYWRDGEVVWITPKDVKGQILHDSQDHLTVQAVKATCLLVYPPNSIFIVFRSGILKHSLPVATCTNPFTVNQDLKVFISNRGVISEYISIFLEKDSEFIINTAVKSGTTVESIDRSIFESMRIALPNEKEQKIIIERIKYVSNRLEREKINKQKLLSIKQGLLHDLLTGRVCVPPHLLEASS
mgnify:CR=1 FL=1